MRKQNGFTMIELILFVIVLGILAKVIFAVLMNPLNGTPAIHNNQIASQAARQCIEWFIGQKHLNGYSSITSPSTTVPAFCTTPSGFNIAVDVANTTLNSDANYITVTVTISGNGDAVSSVLLANY